MTNLEKEKRNREKGIQHRSYTYTRPGSRDGQQEYVVLIAPKSQNFDRVLHEVGLKLVSDNPNYKDVGQAALMEALTPELLAPYNVVLLRPTREAVKLDNKPPVIGAFETESWRAAILRHTSYKISAREYAERIAKRLEQEKANGHPAVSTWGYAGICRRSVTWACDFVEKYGAERGSVKFDDFMQHQLEVAKPVPSKAAEEQPVA